MAARKARHDRTDVKIEEVRQQVAVWRQTGKACRGSRMPAQLWDAAVGLAKIHGVGVIARAIKVDHHSLKQRADARPRSARAAGPAPAPEFVGYALPMVPAGCTVHMEFRLPSGLEVTMAVQGATRDDIRAVVGATLEATS